MSATAAAPAAPATPAVQKTAAEQYQEDYDIVMQDIYLPVFLHKLAEHGFVPRSQEETVRYVKIASNLRMAYDSQQAAATPEGNLLDVAEKQLQTKLASAGLIGQGAMLAAAADEALRNETVKAAVLRMQAANLAAVPAA